MAKPKRLRKDVHVGQDIRIQVLTEAGFRCAVPQCRNILALDMHHMEEVSTGGGDEATNLLSLCPTCHALYHRNIIPEESIYVWKSILVSLGHAFDREAIDHLLFLQKLESHAAQAASRTEPRPFGIWNERALAVSGDGVLRFARLIAAGLADFSMVPLSGTGLYSLCLTDRGRSLIAAWLSGNREAVRTALSGLSNQAP